VAVVLALAPLAAAWDGGYPIVDTGQSTCYDDAGRVIACPGEAETFGGQDAQHLGHPPRYVDNGDGTVSDLVTGLVWQQTPGPKVPLDEAVAGAAELTLGGFTDWRLPTIKELYSLIEFSGETGTDAASSTPYLDTGVFDFSYGDSAAGERFIDAQYCSSTRYVWTTMGGNPTVFGVNFADGRIKGYPITVPTGTAKTFFVRYVRGNPDYGINAFRDNGDGTVSDLATGLMWARADSGSGMTWQDALTWVQERNAEAYLGHADWRLPNAKELQSLVDYDRSPDTTGSAAIEPLFEVTPIVDEGGVLDFPFFWTSTTHLDGPAESRGDHAVYVAFGRALGWMEEPPGSGHLVLQDVHGAGQGRRPGRLPVRPRPAGRRGADPELRPPRARRRFVADDDRPQTERADGLSRTALSPPFTREASRVTRRGGACP